MKKISCQIVRKMWKALLEKWKQKEDNFCETVTQNTSVVTLGSFVYTVIA